MPLMNLIATIALILSMKGTATFPPTQYYTGIAAHYNAGGMESVARVRGMTVVNCMIASDFHPLGTFVMVKGLNTGKMRWCRVTDVSQPKDRKRHMAQHLFELDYRNARVLCGSTRLANRHCPVQVSK